MALSISTNSEVLVKENLLMTLVPPIGYRSEWGALLGFLKLARSTEVVVECSDLEFFDGDERSLQKRHNAFGLTTGMRLSGPHFQKIGDDNRRPEAAVLAKWQLNQFSVSTNLVVLTTAWQALRVVYLPLQVPLPEDHHIVVTIVNLSEDPINIADGMREARCWVDGVAYESVAARLWNGRYLIQPQQATTRLFKLNDFPGVPRHGIHEMSLEILGAFSPPQFVNWCGESWTESISGH
jgi:hypothetical protein